MQKQTETQREGAVERKAEIWSSYGYSVLIAGQQLKGPTLLLSGQKLDENRVQT